MKSVKSKWRKDVTEKYVIPLYCIHCKTLRNRFVKKTNLCAICAGKLSSKGQAKKAAAQKDLK